MGHKDRCFLVREVLRQELLKLVAERQVARQSEDSSQFLLARQASEKRHGAALRETANYYPRCLNALVHLSFDQAVEIIAGFEEAGLILLVHEFFDRQLEARDGFSRSVIFCFNAEWNWNLVSYGGGKVLDVIPSWHGFAEILSPETRR